MKDKQIAIRFTDEEWSKLKKMALKYDMNISELIRCLTRQLFEREKLYK